ncbi:hypothetical protein GLO73106DRAFT_00010700 [Gloeocapsa sp. PCC 73106]|nr:hypothetical protein GLO73106DRAFT_00010700 [Gloeocapsa sp. PCC 73106]
MTTVLHALTQARQVERTRAPCRVFQGKGERGKVDQIIIKPGFNCPKQARILL